MMLGRAIDLVLLGNGKEQQAPAVITVRPASTVSADEIEQARLVPVRALETEVPGAAVIPSNAPDAVVTVKRGPFSWKKAGDGMLGWALVFLWSNVIPAAGEALLAKATSPGFLESLALPPWLDFVDRGLLFVVLVGVKDYRRHKRSKQEQG